MTIGCTDCPISEPVPFSRIWFSHKLRGAGLRYEIAVCIQTGDICWINGPFKSGRWTNVAIFCRNLKHRLAPGEMVESDGGYRGDSSCVTEGASAALAQHHTVIVDVKNFNCLRQVWRHDWHLHKYVFGAGCVITQLSKFQVN
jgi:hypothetical protein